LETAYLTFARASKVIAEELYQIKLHDQLLDHVRSVLDEARQQLQDDKISPYIITEGQYYFKMEQRALLLDELHQRLGQI
jgi:hypothetical protein